MKCRIGPFELDSLIAQVGWEKCGGQHATESNRRNQGPHGTNDQRPQFRDTFRNEARAMSSLRHPHIVRYTTLGNETSRFSQ